MNQRITIREAGTESEILHFWNELNTYHSQDLFPHPDSREDLDYFLSTEYREAMEQIHSRERDRCHYLFFDRNGREIGFCMPVIYDTEDHKCFLMEFCVYPRYRGEGTGKACAMVFLQWAADNGAAYTELNCETPERIRFWSYSGFLPNGRDEWGIPLMLKPPAESLPVTVEQLTDPEDWQLRKLMNGFLAEIGEECLSEEKQDRLQNAIRAGEIVFFLAKRGYRAVGVCSVATAFSTFQCGSVGIFDDFYVEPVFRRQGIARMLSKAAKDWCGERGIPSLTVTCAPCDEEMYRSLGFSSPLGEAFAYLMEQDSRQKSV